MTTTRSTERALVSPPGEGRRVVLRGLQGVDVPADVMEFGTGRPVVFLHGLVGLNDHWEEVAQRAAARGRCILLQLPLLELKGDDCSIHGATELTRVFLERHVGVPAVALRIALERPDLLSGLVLAGSSGLIEKSMVSDVQIKPSREWMERKIGELFFDRSKMNPADVDRAHRELSQRAHARAMVKLSRSARRNHLGDRIGSIRTPTLLVWGRQDIVTPPEAAHELREKIAGSRLVWLEQCGHAPMIERPDTFGEALVEFLEELDRRG
jgi:2-hydroxy-6-oxonona-2,4-dienedioate hydrolase